MRKKKALKTKALITKGDKRKGKELSTELTNPELILSQPTPRHCIYKRKGRGGKTFEYVSIGYVIQKLDEYCKAIKGTWSFDSTEISDTEMIKKTKNIVTKGTLTILTKDKARSITQYGSSEVKMKSDGNGVVDLGDDFKGAASDALKKCASMIGVARDVYFRDWENLTNEPVSSEKIEVAAPKQTKVEPAKNGSVAPEASVVPKELIDLRSKVFDEVKKYAKKDKDAMIVCLKEITGKTSFKQLDKAECEKILKSIKVPF